jgi:NAD dependent epimerase/dehydratase family enzyme
VLTVPPAALRVALGGELVESLLSSQRVLPRKLLDAGFVFTHPTIDEGMIAAVTS